MMKAWGRQRPRVGRFVLAMMLAALIPGWAHAQSVLPQDANGAWQSLTRHNPLGSPRAIYDPLRQRLVVFGTNQPYYPNEVWSFSLAGLPGWIRLVPTTSGSNHLEGESAIYDAAGDRMILFGGYERNNGPPIGWGLRNYTVALLLPGTGEWSFFAIGGTPPAARYHHSAIYDPVRNRMIVFGGSSTGGLANDVWELSLGHGPPKWTQLTPSGAPPSPRAEHSAIYDPVRDRMVVFGGNDGTTRQNDVWALSLAGTPTWSLLTPSGTPPSVRSAHSAIYDADNDRMVVFGGWNGTQYFSDTWTLTLAGATGWAELAPAGTLPGARAYHATVVDPAQHRIIVFGGRSDVAGYSDTWAMSLTGTPTWTALWGNSGPQGPLFRSDHSAIYDPVGDRMLMFGGSVFSGQGNDVWTLPLTNLPKWAPLSPTGTAPSGRFSHSAVYDPVRQRMLILFGLANGSFTNEVWALSLDGPMTWAPLTPTGTPPQGRLSQATIYDPVRDRILVFGGWNGSVHLGDLWSLSLSTDTWTQLTPTGTPPAARTKHTAIYDPVRDRMLLFGGSNAVFLNDVWSLDLAGAPNWTLLGPTGTPPSARDGHVAIYDAHRDRMVTFGGGNDGPLNDVWAMSLTGPPAWSPLVPAGILPLGRERPATIYDPLRDRMVTFAGRWLSTLYDDTWALNWSALHTIAATAGANGIVTPSGAVYVAEATDRTFTISPNSGYQIEDVIVDGVSVGVTGSYTFTNVLAGHSITATFVANAGVGPGAFSSEFSLSSPSPNPCTRGSFNMELGLTRPAHVRLVVYDAAGREVARLADRFFEAGRHALRCTAGTLDTGLYWVHGRADGREVTRRLAVMR